MNSLTIIITGANGFIGTKLVNYFSSKNWNVIAFVHHLPKEKLENVVYREYDLTKSQNEDSFIHADYMIHAAYMKKEMHPNAFEINIQGAKDLLSASRKYNLKKNIFISSMSSRPDALSDYGKQKFIIEKLFNTKEDVIIRPGLVLGDGALAKEIFTFIKKKKIYKSIFLRILIGFA